MIPKKGKFSCTIDPLLQLIPDHTGEEQGSVLVTPSVVQDHCALPGLDSIFVAAIKLHTASSWGVGHIAEGRVLVFTDVKHNGAHVRREFVVLEVIFKAVNVSISHKLNGTVPGDWYQNKLK